jgi:hypothetical protein
MIARSLDRPAVPSAQTRRATAPRPRAAASSGTVELGVQIAVVAFAGVLVVAGVVRAALAHQARGWLGYTFPGVPAHWDVAIGIFAHNGRAIFGVFGLLLIAQIAARHADGPGRTQRGILAAGELILAGMILTNVLVVGAGLGAYGEHMARADLPHGPVELAAYSLALGLYFEGRRRTLSTAHVAKVAAGSLALLAIAAALETFVNV